MSLTHQILIYNVHYNVCYNNSWPEKADMNQLRQHVFC